MSLPPRTRFVSASRLAGVGVADRRKAWVLFVGLAKDHARRAIALLPASKHEAIDFAGVVVRLRGPEFPVAYASAHAAAESTLIAARGFIAAARIEDRAMLGELLLAGAHCLDLLLAQSAVEASAAWRRQLGEDRE